MIRLYYKSDYKIRETFKTQLGEIIDPRDYNFLFTFIAGRENTFICSHTKGAEKEWVNCEYDSENNAVLCILDNHGLLPGKLKRELTIEEPDSDFPDGKLDYITFKAYEIELIDTTDGDTLYDIIDEEVIIFGTTVTPAQLATIIHESETKDDIIDADEVNYLDSENNFSLVKTTWLNIIAKLKTYFDTLFEPKKADTDLYVTSAEKSTWNGKQEALTFSTNIETDKGSTTKISAIKTMYDWATGLFIKLNKIVTSWSATPLDTNIPSEKLVKDSLDLKADMNILEPVQITYAELHALKQSNNLTQNQLYEITDYRNRYQQAVSKEILTSEIEPLIIKAISHNSFSTKAYSKLYPQDEIYYNFENEMDGNPILAPGADRGFIFRRIDTKQRNDFPFDFRHIKFRRWQVTGNEWDVATVYSSRSIVKRNGFLYIGVGNNNVGIDPELNNNTITTLASYAWIKCNFADMSYVSDTPSGLIGTLQFAVTGLYQDYLMFSTEEIYSMSKNNIALYDWHPQSSHNDSHLFAAFNTVFKKETLNPSYNYTGVYNNQIGGDFHRNTILWNFSANKTSITFYINLICDIFDNNLIQSHFRYSYFNKWVTHGTFTNWETHRSIFGDEINASSFLCTGGFNESIIAGRCFRVLSIGYVNNIIAHKNINYSDFSGIMANVVFKKFLSYTKSHNSLSDSTINASLFNVTFEGGIKYLTTGEAAIKYVVFGQSIANADLTTLVYPTTHCRIETVEGTPDKLCIKYLNADGRQCYSIVGLDGKILEAENIYETETNKEADIETYKESTTKYPTLKGLYDWAVAKFLLATKLVTSWSGTPSDENIPSEKLVYDELVNLDANKYDKNATDLLLGAKEDITNKSSNIDTDKTSTTKYANVKAIYDWAVGKFIDLAKIVTTWTATPLNTNIPSEKLVKDGLDSKFNLSGGNTISGIQNFDSNTLVIDSVNHRVGIGTTTPAAKLDVNGTSNFADNMNILSTKNQYLAASTTSDTVNDIRVRNDSGVLKTERCTVANATKGAGTWVDESKADILPATGATSALRALFVSRGAVYNSSTGLYSLHGGLVDNITEQQMILIYNITNTAINDSSNTCAMQLTNIRTHMPATFYSGYNQLSCISRFFRCSFLEAFVYKSGWGASYGYRINNGYMMFYNCVELHTVDFISVDPITNATSAADCFYGCAKLVTAFIKSLKVSFSFGSSTLLSLTSLTYLVTNRANGTTRITITVHATVWSKLNDAVNYPEWNALLVDAVNNQYIDFASA